MSSLTTAISVQVNKKDKKLASDILSELGLNMSTYVNMAIKQLIKKDGVPFEVVNSKPSKEILKSLDESEQIIQEIKSGKRKGYNNMDDLIKSLNDD